jgi:hypothetical protein
VRLHPPSPCPLFLNVVNAHLQFACLLQDRVMATKTFATGQVVTVEGDIAHVLWDDER